MAHKSRSRADNLGVWAAASPLWPHNVNRFADEESQQSIDPGRRTIDDWAGPRQGERDHESFNYKGFDALLFHPSLLILSGTSSSAERVCGQKYCLVDISHWCLISVAIILFFTAIRIESIIDHIPSSNISKEISAFPRISERTRVALASLLPILNDYHSADHRKW